jgi:uncharacterized HhH-GPD family protein
VPGFPFAEVDSLPFTSDAEADRLLVQEPLALLMGFLLDQQVPLQRAFAAPKELRQRVGSLDPVVLLQLPPGALEEAFRRPPALHRFPQMMAARLEAALQLLVREYGGDPARIWEEAPDAGALRSRLLALPGVGPMKAETLQALLALQLGVRPRGWEALLPDHPTLATVRSPEELARYQAQKRERKLAMRS